MPIFEESRLRFNFDDSEWTNIIKFDEHTDYSKAKNALDGTKGVDFLGILKETVCFIEVKNLKDYRIKNKNRTHNIGELLLTEVAQKIKDSIACIIAGNRNSTNDKSLWKNYTSRLCDDSYEIQYVLWLETDNISADSSKKRRINKKNRKNVTVADYQRKLSSKLKWLIPQRKNIKIVNVENYKNDWHMTVEQAS